MFYFSSFEPVYLILPIVGLLVGLFGSMLGGGGGFIFLPVLTLFFNVSAQSAVITSLVATLPICIIGSLGHFAKGNIDTKTGIRFALAGLIGAFAGTAMVGLITEKQLKAAFGLYTILISLNIIFSDWRKSRRSLKSQTKQPSSWIVRNIESNFYAFSAGMITGTFGTSGTAPILTGLFKLHLSVKMVVGTSLLVVLANTLFAVGAHFLIGNVDLTLVGFLTIGSAFGAAAGTRFLSSVEFGKSESSVKYIYATVMVIIGILMLAIKN